MTITQIVLGSQLANNDVGRNIRKAAGISVREAASHIGVDQRTLNNWELGNSKPSGKKAAQWYEFCQELLRIIEPIN